MGKNILDWILDKGTEYAPLLKVGTAALSTYASFKDQQKKNQMQQDAYDDYMAQAAAAGHEARAAIDINYTPMTVSGVPTTKADVTDFTAVAARGGLMSVPNRQRKRYYAGTDEEEVLDTEEEVLSPFDLQQETGIDLMGEQVFHDSGDPRTNAQNVWGSGQINQDDYQMNFEIFFQSGDWMDHISQVDVEENMQMASADPILQDEYDKYVFDIQEQGGTPMSIEQFRDQAVSGMAIGGIAGLRHGGRPGYQDGTPDTAGVVSEVSPSRKTQIEGNQEIERAYNQIITKFYETFPGAIKEEEYSLRDMVAMMQAEGVINQDDLEILGFKESMDMITPASVEKSAQRISMGDTQFGNVPEELFAQGGRPGYQFGIGPQQGIMPQQGLMPQGMMQQQGLRPGYAFGPGPVVDQETMAESITLPDGGEEVVTDSMTEIEGQTAGSDIYIIRIDHLLYNFPDLSEEEAEEIAYDDEKYYEKIGHDPYAKGGKAMAQGGRIGYAQGSGIMDLGGMEKDYRTTGGFVPLGGREKADDVPARLSKNEFVMTADAVRAAGGGSINKGAQRMYDTMKHLEASPQSKRMTA